MNIRQVFKVLTHPLLAQVLNALVFIVTVLVVYTSVSVIAYLVQQLKPNMTENETDSFLY